MSDTAAHATRHVVGGCPDVAKAHPNNLVRNTKYTPWNFLPKNVMEQFERPLNRYFLMIACLQMVPILAPVNPLSTWVPLLLAFGLTAAKEGLDDLARYKLDKEFNTRGYWVAGGDGVLREVESQEINVGDIVKVTQGKEIPCDLVLLQSSDDDGIAYIRTDNLDGEIDLKERAVPDRKVVDAIAAPGVSADAKPYDVRSLQQHTVTCDAPNAKIYSFNSRLDVHGQQVSLSSAQLLLQSCFLINTEWVLGMAVYTGAQTKAGMNRQAPPVKWAGVDRQVSRYSVFVLCFQITLALIMGILGNVWWADERAHWYLTLHAPSWYETFIIPIRFFLLTSVMIPISFKVIIDISKYYISLAIGWDLDMYTDEIEKDEGGCPARANNTAIAEDLGQIEYILTDKTGTLTDNVMTFKACSLGGLVCGGGSGVDFNPTVSPFEDPAFATRSDDAYMAFARTLALCHGVNVNLDGSYAAASPDEEALVHAACRMRVALTARTKTTMTIAVGSASTSATGAGGGVAGGEETYDILHVFDFNSDRKMMSVLVRRCDTGAVTLLSKGADDKMLARMAGDAAAGGEAAGTLIGHLSTFASAGLRTLVLGSRVVPEEEYTAWAARLKAASCETGPQRDVAVQRCYADMERGFALVGATAIEDKLQDGVPETVATLREAGIAIWMLTGDKYETAKQIARSCGLWREREELLELRLDTTSENPREALMKDLNKAHNRMVERGRSPGGGGITVLGSAGIPAPGGGGAAGSPARARGGGGGGGRNGKHNRANYGTFKRMIDCCRGNLASAPAGGGGGRGGLGSRKVRTSNEDVDQVDTAGLTVSGGGSGISYRSKSRAAGSSCGRSPQSQAGGGMDRTWGSGSGIADDYDDGFVLIVEGTTLEVLLDPANVRSFKELCMDMNTIIACRVTPGQKAAITRMAKTSEAHVEEACCMSPFIRSDMEGDRTVLSIGDGGNDVSMIQEATIGVGIVGKEGKQASRAADYRIGRFRFLLPLLLVHGQYSYQRSCFITQYCFYKSFALAFVQMLYNASASFSGVSYWTSLMLLNWNGVYTLPQPFLYVLDRVAPRAVLLSQPRLYGEPQCGAGMTASSFFIGNLAKGIFHSVVCYGVTVYVFSGDYVDASGRTVDFRAISTITFTAIMMIQMWVVVLGSHTMTALNLAAVFGMPVVYVIATMVLSSIPPMEYYKVGHMVFGDPVVWLVVFLTTLGLMAPSYALNYAMLYYFPTPLLAAWHGAAQGGHDANASSASVELEVTVDRAGRDNDSTSSPGSPYTRMKF